jgi:lysozyme
MNISQNGIDMIKKFEGCVLVGYKDVVGVPTIGYGHTGGVVVGQRITQARANELLNQDLKKFVDGVNRLVKVPVNQNQFDSLVSFSFNLGLGSLEKSTLLKKLNTKDYEGASKEFDKWIYADGEIYQGLVNRRNAEETLFRKAVPPAYSLPNGVYKMGSKGKEVKQIQNALNHLSFKCGVADGVWGAKTNDAIRRFQSMYAQPVDGVYGSKTRSAMLKQLNK